MAGLHALSDPDPRQQLHDRSRDAGHAGKLGLHLRLPPCRGQLLLSVHPDLFCGHSHVPVAFCKKPITSINERSIDEIPEWTYNYQFELSNTDFNYEDELTVEIKAGYKYLFNVGSIGQPRNRDPRSSFAIMDTDAGTITRYRIPYDIAAQQNKIIDAGLPERLALRLAVGT